jgi:hypothetical protein
VIERVHDNDDESMKFIKKWGDPKDKSWMGLCFWLFVAHTKATPYDIGDKLESPLATLEVVCVVRNIILVNLILTSPMPIHSPTIITSNMCTMNLKTL